jgi:biopolymer transport protein ExbD
MKGPASEHGDDVVSEMNVIPFIDVCLVLLIIVLMTSAAVTSFTKLRLPVSESNEYRDVNLAVTLSVNQQGQFFYEDEQEPIEAGTLWVHLRTVLAGNPPEIMMIRSDQATPGEYLVQAIQCAQSLGVGTITLGVQDKQQAAAEESGAQGP